MKQLFFLTCLLFSLSATAQPGALTPHTLDPALLQEDFSLLYQQLQQNHPKLFAYYSKEEADAQFAEISKKLSTPMDRLAFLRIASPFVSQFKDGHTYLSTDFGGKDMEQYANSGGTFFPLEVTIINNRLYCKGNPFAVGSLKKGDEIISINHEPVSSLLPTLKTLLSADGEATANANVQRLFGYFMWLHGQHGTHFTLEAKQGEKRLQEKIRGASMEEFNSLIFIDRRPVFHLFPEQSLAVVQIKAYGNVKQTNAFIDSCFQVIKQHNISNVALDLRSNGGGSSVVGEYFLGHVTRKPYGTTSSKSWRVGPLVQQLDSTHWMYHSVADARNRYHYRQEGDYLHSAYFAPEPPPAIKDSSLFSPAALYVFTSAQTYSSAHMTALSVKCGELGTIIGQATGERLDLTGETLEYVLPHSKLSLTIPVASYQTACGDGAQVGVQPDYVVETTAEDLRQGRDPELAFLLNLLSAKSGR